MPCSSTRIGEVGGCPYRVEACDDAFPLLVHECPQHEGAVVVGPRGQQARHDDMCRQPCSTHTAQSASKRCVGRRSQVRKCMMRQRPGPCMNRPRCGVHTCEAMEVCGVAVPQGVEQQVDRGGQVEKALLLQHRPCHLHRVLLALPPREHDRTNELCRKVIGRSGRRFITSDGR